MNREYCSCHRTLNIEAFPNHKTKYLGKGYTCKECARVKVKQWKKDNPFKVKRNAKRYREKHASDLREKSRQREIRNKDARREYRQRPEVKARRPAIRAKWNIKRREQRRSMTEAEKEVVRAERRALHRESVQFRIACNIRTRIRTVLRNLNKQDHSLALLGCSPRELKQYLESKFLPGMSWDNYGKHGWHIDHIIPCAARNPDGSRVFDLTKLEDQQRCFHWSNLQPLWAKDNWKKQNKMEVVE